MIKQIIIPMLVIAAVFTYSGCSKQDTSSKQEKKINVAVKPAETKSLRPFIEAVGTLNPYDEVPISTEVEGIIVNMTIDEGTVVTKGMLISAVSDTDYLLEVTRAKAMLRQAAANLSNINMEYQRKESLFKDGLISMHDYDSVSPRMSFPEVE